MISQKTVSQIKEITSKYSEGNTRFFIFGSSVADEKFNDIDLGTIDGSIDGNKMEKLREDFEESLIPYKIDVIDFNNADKKFREKILKDKIIWLT